MISEVTIAEVRGGAEACLAAAERSSHVAETLENADIQRWGAAEDIRKLQSLAVVMPQLPEAGAHEVYGRIVQAESLLVAPDRRVKTYGLGTAQYPDELAYIGQGSVLMEAQHGSDPVRKATGKREAADHGTAGLTAVLAYNGLGLGIIPRGRQTSNANVAETHPIKDALTHELARVDAYLGFLSIHGMRPGKVVSLRDPSEIHAVIGLGKEPKPASLEKAEALIARARDELGLRLVVGNLVPHVNFDKSFDADRRQFRDSHTTVTRKSDGEIAIARLAAATDTSTTTFMSRATDVNFPAIQLEISRSLRLMPKDQWSSRDLQAEKMGVYMGYRLGVLAAEVVTGTINT